VNVKKLVILFSLIAVIVAGALVPDTVPAAAKKIGVMWVGKSAMPKRVSLGFMAEIKRLMPDVQVVSKRDLPNWSEGELVFHQFQREMDGVVVLRSNGAEFLGKLETPPLVPCFVGACNDPQFLGAVANRNAPDKNITGVTYYVPYDKRFKALLKLIPDIKSVALLAERGHPGALLDKQGTRRECEKRGIQYYEVEAGSVDELVAGAREIADKVDLFILAANSLVQDNTVSLLPVSNNTKTPMFAYSSKPVKHGAVAGIAARDEYLGTLLAESVADVVGKGKSVSSVPIKTDPEPKLMVSQAMIRMFGITIPETLLAEVEINQ
jgi:putative ABC transport system substrate-binding protein